MGEYTCPKCGITFPTQDALLNHSAEHKEDTKEDQTQHLDFYPQ